jgi:hypothetical protein
MLTPRTRKTQTLTATEKAAGSCTYSRSRKVSSPRLTVTNSSRKKAILQKTDVGRVASTRSFLKRAKAKKYQQQ